MLEIARSKVKSEQVEFVLADFLKWDGPKKEFDLIVTNFFLDCFSAAELAVVIARLGEMATPEANWLLADFEIAPARLARWRSRVIVAMLYGFFRIVCGLKVRSLESPDQDLKIAGFSRQQRMTWEWGLLKGEWWRRG